MTELRDKLVLVVDDEARITSMMRMNLEAEGVRVIAASNGREALDAIREEIPDIVILDVMMPGMDGYETLRRIRTSSQVPVIMLTAKDEENDRIKGLELGADDYIGKPFSYRELVSRIKAVLRRHYQPAPSAPGHVNVDERLHIDFNKREVLINGERINLRPTEYRLLEFFLQHPTRVFTREELLNAVWGPDIHVEPRTVDVHIRRLRKAINAEGEADIIRTVRAAGYALDTEPA